MQLTLTYDRLGARLRSIGAADDLLARWFTLHHIHEVAERRG